MTKRYTFKATVALEALRGDKTAQESAAKRPAPYAGEHMATAGD